jgi:regulatory protein YycI of two-component signal transduction system YycFG
LQVPDPFAPTLANDVSHSLHALRLCRTQETRALIERAVKGQSIMSKLASSAATGIAKTPLQQAEKTSEGAKIKAEVQTAIQSSEKELKADVKVALCLCVFVLIT